MAAALLCAVSVGVNAPGISNVYAATVTESTGTSQTKRPEKGSQRGQNGEKPEEKGTRYVGKITSLTSSTITVELGEMKQKEKPAEGTSGTKPEKPADGTSGTRQKKSADSTDAAAGAAKDSAKEKKDLNPEDFITLTGETKTITVTDSTKFRSRGKKNADGTETADTAGEFTISDLAAGDYITFLADEDGSILEVSKGIGMGGRGRHGGPQDDRKQKETTAAAQ
jgi:hypothetical protein